VEHHRFPPEIRNELYKCSALPENVETVERSYKTVGADGAIMALDSVHSFYLDPVSHNGKSQLFSKDVTNVAAIADELLSLVTPWILFVFDSPRALRLFAEAFASHTAVCTRQIQLHVEFDFGATMDEASRTTFARWVESEVPHGRHVNAHQIFEEWVLAVQELPSESTHLHLIFPYFWRDFRSLRGLSEKTGIRQYPITFRFPADRGHPPLPDYDFFVAQTIAAVKGIEVSEQAGISETRRTMLVRHGCTGFNLGRRPPSSDS
jgi:hypothetical protein